MYVNHVFYVVSTHKFFYIIGLRSNSLHPSSTSSLHRSQITFFFYGRTNHRSAATAATAMAGAGAGAAAATAMAGVGAGASSPVAGAGAGGHR